MTSAPLDPQGEASRALAAAIEDFGPRALSSPVVLANLFKDLLPDSPRETTILVAVAEAGLAKAITDRIDEGLPPDAATYQAATIVTQARAMDPAAVQWAARQFATALGYQVGAGPLEQEAETSPFAAPPSPPWGTAEAQAPWGGPPPAPNWPPAETVPSGPGGPSAPGGPPLSPPGTAVDGSGATIVGSPAGWGFPGAAAAPGPQSVPPGPPAPAGGFAPPAAGGFAPPVPAGGFGSPVAPSPWASAPAAWPGQGPGFGAGTGTGTGPAGTGPGAGGTWPPQQNNRPGRSKVPLYLAVVAAVAVIVVVIVVVAGSGGGSHSASSTTTSAAVATSGSPSTTVGIGTSTTGTVPPTSAATVTTQPSNLSTPAETQLAKFLPTDLDPQTDCQTETGPPAGLANISAALACGAPTGLPGGSVFAYQFTSPATLQAGLTQYNKDKAFDTSTAGDTCPPGSEDEGIATWANGPNTLSGNLECLTLADTDDSSITMPAYIWTITQDNAIVEAIGSKTATFAQLNSWFLAKNVPQ